MTISNLFSITINHSWSTMKGSITRLKLREDLREKVWLNIRYNNISLIFKSTRLSLWMDNYLLGSKCLNLKHISMISNLCMPAKRYTRKYKCSIIFNLDKISNITQLNRWYLSRLISMQKNSILKIKCLKLILIPIYSDSKVGNYLITWKCRFGKALFSLIKTYW